jgi:uncharacterized protein YukE
MDATSSVGGPGTIVPMIATGSPEQIASLVTQRLRQAAQFLQLIEQLNSATQQLQKAWTGGASQAAVKKLTDTVAAFQKIVKVIQAGAKLLSTSGTLVKSAQTAYTGVVSSVNPTVASLMSNPWTYSSAVALSTTASSSLRGYITGTQGALQGLGSGQLMQQVTALLQIVQEIEKLAGGSGTSTPAGSIGSLPGMSTLGTPIATPVTPPQIASTVGQQVAATGQDPTVQSYLNGVTNYTPTALAGYTGTAANPVNTGTAATAANPAQYGVGQTDSWIPVNPTAPTTAPAQNATITNTVDGVTTTVTVSTNQATSLTVTETVDGHNVTERIDVSADGRVTVA